MPNFNDDFRPLSAHPLEDDILRFYRRLSKLHGGNEYNSERLAPQDKLFTKPTLLCCGGGYINWGNFEDVRKCSGFAKFGHALLGAPTYLSGKEPFDIVSIVYPSDRGLTNPFVEKFAQEQLFPLVEQDGKRLSLEDASRNLRNVMFLTHSFGSYFVQRAGNALHDKMVELHYSPQEIHDATSQVVVVSGGGIAPIHQHRASFTKLELVNRDDKTAQEYFAKAPRLNDMIDTLLRNRTELKGWDVGKSYPAKSLMVLPVAVTPPHEASEAGQSGLGTTLDYAPESRHLIAYLSLRLSHVPEAGAEHPPVIPAQIRSDTYASFVKGKPPELRGSSYDGTGHGATNFFTFGAGQHGAMPALMASSTLVNAMENAVTNHKNRGTDIEFTPLPAPRELLHMPKEVHYLVPSTGKRPGSALLAPGLGYAVRVNLALPESGHGLS